MIIVSIIYIFRNNIIDGDETDIDCGGLCSKCELNKKCKKNEDCESDFCLTSNMNSLVDIDSDELYNHCFSIYCLL